MTDPTHDDADDIAPAVYAEGPDGAPAHVHEYQGSDYHLHDIVEFFELGEADTTADGWPALALTEAEVRRLKTAADAYSFDHDEGLIALCLDIHRYAGQHAQPQYWLWQTF